MLWIALHLPCLSLESFAATLPQREVGPVGEQADAPPIALADAHHIVSANARAQALGVKSGLKRSTAMALAPGITLGQANAARDVQAMASVVHVALAFTPSVTLEPCSDSHSTPHTVLLEVRASLRYFGGRNALLQRLHTALAPLNHTVHFASAPTPRGAALLARLPEALEGRHALDKAALERMLDAMPVWLLGPGCEHWDVLQGMGVHTLADLRGLPRSGLNRRFGELLLAEFDRACGARPDPRSWVSAPEAFSSRLELFARADTTEQVLYGASLLLVRLMAWASAQHALVSRFTLHMQHEARYRQAAQTPAASTIEIALAEPSRDAAHLLVLLRERLAHVQLAAPTLELQITCTDIVRKAPPNSELFPTAKSEREGLTRLIERLQARLGRGQVQRLMPVADHRPECSMAWQTVDAALVNTLLSRKTGVKKPVSASAAPQPSKPGGAGMIPLRVHALHRPVWLLPKPEPLHEQHFRPLLDGHSLQLLCGPQRIETGWWQPMLAERDYFIALAKDGALVWIYRARLPLSSQQPGWFLQGRFG